MATLTDAQIAAVAAQGGFPSAQIATAVAVCLAESGGRTDATNHNSNGSTDYGLWQINSVHAQLLQSGSWSNPADNARMAYTVYKGQGWEGWTTHNTGAYLRFMARGQKAAGNPDSNIAAGAVDANNPQYGKPGYPPFDPQKLHSPLTTAQRTVVVAWLIAQSLLNIGGGKAPDYSKATDVVLIADYVAAVGVWQLRNAPITGPGAALENGTSIGHLIKWLTDSDNWLRVGLFIAGCMLCLLAAYRLAKGQLPSAVRKVVPT